MAVPAIPPLPVPLPRYMRPGAYNAMSASQNPYVPRPGLLGQMFGWGESPLYQALRPALSDIGYGLLSGDLSKIGERQAQMEPYRQQQRAMAQQFDAESRGRDNTARTIYNMGPEYSDLADAVASGTIDVREGWNSAFKRNSELAEQAKIDAKNKGNSAYLKDPALKQAVASGAMSFADAYKLEHGGGATDYGMTPIWGQFADGAMGYGVQGSDGQFHPVDTGSFTPMDPRTLYTERAAGSKIGAGEGTRTLDAPIAAQNVAQLNAKTEHVQDVIDKAIGQVAWDSTGMVGQVMGAFGGSKAYDLRKTAQTVKANLGFAELQAMRDASPTGGALGSIAVQELESLQSTLESLDPNQSEDQLRQNLQTIKLLLDRQKQFREQAYEAKFGPYDGQDPAAPAADIPSADGQVTAVSTKQQYDALPSGSQYIAPDGSIRTKP